MLNGALELLMMMMMSVWISQEQAIDPLVSTEMKKLRVKAQESFVPAVRGW